MVEEGRAHHRRESVVKTPSDYEIVIKLAESQASDPSIIIFPPGCPVCFNHTNTSASKYYAREGVITSVSMGKDPSKPNSPNMVIIYDVESSDEQGVKSTSRFLQDSLAYAYNCPVFLTRDNDEKIEAEIAFSHSITDAEKGRSHFVYMVVYREEGLIKTEKGVKPARVRFRRISIAEPSQSENIEGANTEDAAVEKDNQPVEHIIGEENNSMAGMKIPQEITSNQMDCLSEALTEVAESSQEVQVVENNDEETYVHIKEEPKLNETSPNDVNVDVVQTKHVKATKEKDYSKTVSDENSGSNSFPEENAHPFSAETILVAENTDLKNERPSSHQGGSHLHCDVNRNDDKIETRDISAENPETNNMSLVNEKDESNVLTNERWKPPKNSPSNSSTTALNTSTSEHDATEQGSFTQLTRYICEIKIKLPPWLYKLEHNRNELFENILGRHPNGKRGYNLSQINRDTGCKVRVECNCNPMYVLITPENIENNMEKAENQIKSVLVQCLLNPSSKNRLLQYLAANTTRKHEHLVNKNQNQKETLQRSSSTTSSGKVHPRDDISAVAHRPEKVRKRGAGGLSNSEEIIIPSWISCKRGLIPHLIGKGGCKEKEVFARTECNFRVIEHASKIVLMKSTDLRQVNVARNMVLDSFIEFVDDEHSNGKLLCELSSQPTYEPTKISLYGVVQKLDHTSQNGILWAVSIDLPFHEHSKQYHGIFLESTVKKIYDYYDCTLQLYGGSLGHKLTFPGCSPYVLIHGRRKADVVNAVALVRQTMQNHQKNCSCTPSW